MFREFFCNTRWRTRLVAWAGLASVVGYAVFLAWVKRDINEWYNRFYDTVASSGAAALLLDDLQNATDVLGEALGEAGSGAFFPAAPPAAPPALTLADYRARHALTRSDTDLQALSASSPLIACLLYTSPSPRDS